MPPPAPAILALLQTGLAAQKAGRPEEAERCFRRVLAADPGNPDALQLLGLLAKAAGRLELAADLMRQSLRANRHQPHVLNNLGNLLLQIGDAAGALQQYQAALILQAGYVEARYNSSKALDALGRSKEAEAALQAVLQQKPDHRGALTDLGVMMMRRQEAAAAEILYRRALASGPPTARLLHNIGSALRALGRDQDAETVYRQAVGLEPDFTEAWNELGNTLTQLSRFPEAIDAYRKAIEIAPLDRAAHTNLSKLLWRLGRKDEALDSFRACKHQFPDRIEALVMAAEAEAHLGAPDEAAEDLEQAFRLSPDDPGAHRVAGRLALDQAQPETARSHFMTALAKVPDHPDLLRGLTEAALRSGHTDQALATARQLRRRLPADVQALAYEGVALRLRQDPEEQCLNDYNRFVRAMDLPAPSGWPDIDTFNQDLLQALESLHTTVAAPVDQTLRHGTQTSGSLFRPGLLPPPVATLRTMIEAAVLSYVSALPDDATHPFLSHRTPELRFTGSWSSRLSDEGFHTDHIHPAGWLSGCYYVEVPSCCVDEDAKQGWLKFGDPGIGPEIRLPWIRAIQPKPGRLALFPSYFWHGTIPFRSSQYRTTVAFDMAPL